METTHDMTTTILNDLVEINNDRIVGYQKAIEELKDSDSDLKVLFTGMIAESQTYKMALASEISALGDKVDTGTTNSGKIYRAWMDVKALFTGRDRKTVLENCEFGEDAAQKAYKMALESESLPSDIREMISTQKAALRQSHDKIKSLRDMQHH
ncbi:PA2169 family four-helix-bundle protein [Desertivirga arenae]|uniref:PA2169 family four-helix-bundle protein n=1 Tax=Desertivirga arenae TaxID=2810309 RepID=UPI001A9593C5|nr:PA2169 family four-helix-bundle protein [Pedobacter sp. SYSU D00823]